jgi:hypothetical protein
MLTDEFSTSSAIVAQNIKVRRAFAPGRQTMNRTRLMISALLLASAAAAPALAQDGWHRNGENRGENRGGHQGGGERGADRPPQAQPAPQAQPGPQPQAAPQRGPQPGVRNDRGQGWQARPDAQPRPDNNSGWRPRTDVDRGDAGRHIEGRPDNGVQVWRNDPRRGDGQRDDRSDDRNGWDRNRGDRDRGNWDRNGRNDRPGGWNGNRGRPGNWDRNDRGNWNQSWRNDRRYDWRGYRDAHRDTYRAGRYRVPYGYHGGYRRWGIGVRIDPIFFGQSYWISDPWYYRLPPAYGNYRWVRYYNDALLVDIYSGMVVDEIPDFFW